MGLNVASVDIGGTNTKIGIFNEKLHLLGNKVIATPITNPKFPSMDVSAFLDQLVDEISFLEKSTGLKEAIKGIGLGVPGKVNSDRGIVYNASNLGWEEVALTSELRLRRNIPVAIEHDVSAYAIGEAIGGAGVGFRNVICVTIGTGIAAGIIVDGNVVHGGDWCAGEIGHDIVDGETKKCLCGKIGCLETIVSGPGIARSAQEFVISGDLLSLADVNKKITAFDVSNAALHGDKVAKAIFDHAGTLLGRKLSTLVHALNPEIIIIGGGVAEAGELLLAPVREELWRNCPDQKTFLVVKLATLGDTAGLVGAASCIINLISKDYK